MIIIPFEVIIPDDEKDTKLIEKLKAELPGILRWALEAFPGLIERDGFTESELCKMALKKYMAQADGVRLFVDQMCEEATTTTCGSELYFAYQNFCKFIQIDKKEGRNDFYKRLADIGYKPVPNGNNAKLFNLRLSE
jgi:putative DNA primase/helicase